MEFGKNVIIFLKYVMLEIKFYSKSVEKFKRMNDLLEFIIYIINVNN